MRLLNWLARALIMAVIVSCVSAATTFLMINAFIQQLSEQLGAGSLLTPLSITALFESQQETIKPPAGEAGSHERQSATNRPQDLLPEAEDPHSWEREAVPENALPVMGQAEFESAGVQDELYISMEDLMKAKESLSDEERSQIFSMLITKVPPEEMQTISALLEDGLDLEEMNEASHILQKHLTEEEYETLQEILIKHNR